MGVGLLHQVRTQCAYGLRPADYPVGTGHIERQAAQQRALQQVRIEGREAAAPQCSRQSSGVPAVSNAPFAGLDLRSVTRLKIIWPGDIL